MVLVANAHVPLQLEVTKVTKFIVFIALFFCFAGAQVSAQAQQGRRVTVHELPANYAGGYEGEYLEYRLTSVDRARIAVVVSELAARHGITGPVDVELQFVYEGGLTSSPYGDNAREEFKKLEGELIRDGADVAADTLGYNLPHPLGYGTERAVRRTGDTVAKVVVNPQERKTYSIQVSIRHSGSSSAPEVVTFNYDVTYYENGTPEVRVEFGERLAVIGMDARGSLHLAGPYAEPIPAHANLDGLWDVISASVAIVEVWR